MAAARDPTTSAVAAVRASRRATPIAAAGCALVAGVLLLGNPFAANPPAPLAPPPQVHAGTAELSPTEPTRTMPAPVAPRLPPAPARFEQASASAFVVRPAQASTTAAAPISATPAAAPPPAAAIADSPSTPSSTPTPPTPAPKQMGGGKRATIIVETLPAKPIIPPFAPKQPAGATPEPHPPLPLDTEIETKGATHPAPKPSPTPTTAAANPVRNG